MTETQSRFFFFLFFLLSELSRKKKKEEVPRLSSSEEEEEERGSLALLPHEEEDPHLHPVLRVPSTVSPSGTGSFKVREDDAKTEFSLFIHLFPSQRRCPARPATDHSASRRAPARQAAAAAAATDRSR